MNIVKWGCPGSCGEVYCHKSQNAFWAIYLYRSHEEVYIGCYLSATATAEHVFNTETVTCSVQITLCKDEYSPYFIVLCGFTTGGERDIGEYQKY